MALVIGIDEAGYGPNLGPLVQSAVAIRVDDPKTDLWQTLKSTVRRAAQSDDGRLAVDDSKAVHQGPNGFARLEEGVMAVFPQAMNVPLCDWLKSIAVNGSANDLAGEAWYAPNLPLPLDIESDTAIQAAGRWSEAVAAAGLEVLSPRSAITPTPRFNEVVSEHGSKGAVTGRGIISLIADCYERADGEALYFTIDKLGGRNFYAAMIQTALPDGWVMPIREGAELSEYRVEALKVPVHISVKPRADSDQMPVAIASMLSKYLREVLMRQFNDYWRTHVPGLVPTAGYPNDAVRFYSAIRPACERLGFTEEDVWRKK